MTADETAALLVLASGGLAALIRPAYRALFPGRKIRQAVLQPVALAVAAGFVVGYHALQPGPLDWGRALTQAGMAWVLANGRIIAARPGKPKKEEPPMS